jgi:predicted N-acetyltransferase YhbS/putative sterol carrier protein
MMNAVNEKQDNFSCRTLRREDENEVKMLVKTCFSEFLEGEFWNWKYKLNPTFNPDLVMVAEKEGCVIGCNHWLLKHFRLSPSLESKAILGADIAVIPEYRGRGVGRALIRALRSSEVLITEKPAIIYMFADPALAERFHTPEGGYVPAPDKTAFYFKILNWKKLESNIQSLNEKIKAGKFQKRLSKFNLRVLFKIPDAPPLNLNLSEKGVTLERKENCFERVDVTIVADLATLQKVGAKKKRLRNVFKALVSRKLKINATPKRMLVLYRNLWILHEIFSRKIY